MNSMRICSLPCRIMQNQGGATYLERVWINDVTHSLLRGRLALRRVGSGARSSGSQPKGDGTSSCVPKDIGEVRSLSESMSRQIKSSCLNFDLIIPDS